MAALPKEYWHPPVWAALETQVPAPQPVRYHHYKPLPGPEWIRLLIIEPAANFQDALVCSIEVVPLQPFSNYAALSYSWGMESDGDKSLSRIIEIAGNPMHVTRNLYEGLCRIRPRGAVWDPPKRLWIDGICINQADDDERSAQVAVMALIYQYATETIIWLGEGSTEVEDVMVLRLLEQLEACHNPDIAVVFKAIIHTRRCLWNLHRLACTCYWNDPTMEKFLGLANGKRIGEFYGEALPSAVKHMIEHLYPDLADVIEEISQVLAPFLSRRYWNRRWVVQELFYSRSKHIYWGPCRLDLSQRRFDQSLDKIRAVMRNISWTAGGEVHNLHNDSCPFQRLSDDAEAIRELFRPSYPDSTSLLVHALGRFNSMDCQDPRDRLYSLISLDQSLNIVPSYQLTLAEAYLQFAQALIDRGMFMDIFHNFRQRFAVPESSQLSLPSWVPDLRLSFVSIPRRTVKIPRELWAHRDGSLSCSLYYLGTVDAVGMSTSDAFHVRLLPTSVRHGSTVNTKCPLHEPVTPRFTANLDELVIGTPKALMIEPGDFVFSPIPMELPSSEWETTRVMFLRRVGSYGDTMACRIIGGLPAHALKSANDDDLDPSLYSSIAAPAAPMMMLASMGPAVIAAPAALLLLLLEVCAAAEEPDSEPEDDPEEAVVPAERLDAMDVIIAEEESVVAVLSELVIGDELSPVCAAKELTIDE
ncbi:hypothetical protein PRZ48_011975 [Zasmidium cellare]|uniref:Heterokaryon incompatibility domain-containing protein n=1 Tax=Zasmidium cellare TaxID=395010 RepID=A0ABR0E7W7_ZASCE|nr:hypothetical protein PRZ48_011975 [Zasmidium cellare]